MIGKSVIPIFCFLLSFNAYGQELIEDILSYREKNPGSSINISNIINNHIAIGDTWTSTLENLEKTGFDIFLVEKLMKLEKNSHFDAIYYARYDTRVRKWYGIGFGDVIGISIFLENESVADVSGKIIYMSP